MPWTLFFIACGLFLIFEGAMPFLSPKQWKLMMLEMQKLQDRTLRIFGLISMLSGLVVITLVHYFY